MRLVSKLDCARVIVGRMHKRKLLHRVFNSNRHAQKLQALKDQIQCMELDILVTVSTILVYLEFSKLTIAGHLRSTAISGAFEGHSSKGRISSLRTTLTQPHCGTSHWRPEVRVRLAILVVLRVIHTCSLLQQTIIIWHRHPSSLPFKSAARQVRQL